MNPTLSAYILLISCALLLLVAIVGVMFFSRQERKVSRELNEQQDGPVLFDDKDT